MKAFFILIAILAIIWFVAAKIINNTSYEIKHGEVKKLPDSAWFLILGLVVFAVFQFLTIIPAQECGVVVTPAGVKHESYPTGWHIVMPWYKVERMDKTVQVYTCASLGSKTDSDDNDDIRMNDAKRNSVQGSTIWAPTVDGIKMGFAISASWKIDPEYAWWIYDNVSELDDSNNGRFLWLEENVIKAKLKSALALTASKYTPIEVYSNKREEIQELTKEKMRKDIQDYHLILDQIDIREVYYNPEYEKAINQKKLEEQAALTLIEVTKQKEELLKQAEIEKNISITKAEAEAKALQIKGQSIASNPRIVELEWINKWNGELPTYMFGGNQSMILGMPNK
jgi:regulator of protease activity HflC (stomatin/prohibitin superfamily)